MSRKEDQQFKESKEKSKSQPKRSPRQKRSPKNQSPRIEAAEQYIEGALIDQVQKDIFETSTHSLGGGSGERLQMGRSHRIGHEVGVQASELRQDAANVSNPSVNITIGMQTPLERSVDYL